MPEVKHLTVGEIEDQGDRVLLHKRGDRDFYAIASQAQCVDVRVGDRITYEPYGVNFGWFLARLPASDADTP